MNIIVFEESAYWKHLEQVIDWVKSKIKTEEKWINEKVAMELLNINSKTTMWQLRSDGKVRFSQPSKKVILYDRESIMQYLEDNAKETF